LAGVEGARQKIFKEDRVRNTDGLQVLHRGAKFTRAELLIALEDDLAHLYGRAFLDIEGQCNGGWRNRLDLGLDDRELMSVLAEHLLKDDFSTLDARFIELALDGETDFFFLPAVVHIGDGDGVQALEVH